MKQFYFFRKNYSAFFTVITLKIPRPKKIRKIEDNIIKDVGSLFRLKKEIYGNTVRNTKNLFRLKKENETIQDEVIRDIRNLFEHNDLFLFSFILFLLKRMKSI